MPLKKVCEMDPSHWTGVGIYLPPRLAVVRMYHMSDITLGNEPVVMGLKKRVYGPTARGSRSGYRGPSHSPGRFTRYFTKRQLCQTNTDERGDKITSARSLRTPGSGWGYRPDPGRAPYPIFCACTRPRDEYVSALVRYHLAHVS